MASLLGDQVQPKNPSRGKPVYAAPRFETGLFTNRSALHDPAQWVYSKFYGGYTDVLFDGSNMEISNKLTLVKRYGLSEWSDINVPDAPNWFYNWHTLTCGVDVVVDTPTSTYVQTATTQTKIFSKSAGAGQGYYQGVANTLYYGDGIDLQQFILGSDCNPANGKVWNWGIVAPTTAPVLAITPSAGAVVSWFASTVASTMGLVVDSNNNIQQLISVNATGTNTTQFGTTGNGAPAWNDSPGQTTTDNGWNWTNWGPIELWQPHHIYQDALVGGSPTSACIIYDPTTKACFIVGNSPSGPGTSGTTKPHFPAGLGSSVSENAGGPGITWFNIGIPGTWQASHTYPAFGGGASVDQQAGVTEPNSLAAGLPSTPITYWQINHTGSSQTSASAFAGPGWSTTPGTTTGPDGDMTWLNLGPKGRLASTFYTAWSAPGTAFSAIVGPGGGNFFVCIVSGTSSNVLPTFNTGYGQQTIDGGVTWVCVGQIMTWAPTTRWYLPSAGFFAPQGSVKYGGALIVDTNNNVQAVTQSGLTGTVEPSVWGTTAGATTTDNAATWIFDGPFNTQGFSLTKGASYAYSYTSRTTSDIYNTTAPPDWPSPLGPPTGSGTGHVSTASPLATITGPMPTSVVTLTIPGSADPQVDTITIWRTLDGGSTLFFLTEVPNTPPIGGVQQFQTVNDVSPDSVINNLIEAPINDQNDPPPAGFKPMAYHFQRIWGAVGNFVYASGGPDVLTGDPNEAFDPLDFFEFPSPVTAIIPTATGILVFLTNSVYAILGGPLFATFFSSPMVPGIGLLHYNGIDIHGGVIYMFTADQQFIAFDPSGGAQRMGGAIADRLQTFSSLTTYVTVHESGNDNAIFISDGANGWYRLNPNQFPNNNAVWSPFAGIVNGAKAVQSIEVTTGDHRLLVGGTGPDEPILFRDLTVWEDNGEGYSCFATIGSLNMAQPGQIAGLTFANVRATQIGSAPTVSFLLNELSGTFTDFPSSQAYPWQIYGAFNQPSSLYSNAYYFRAAGVPALCEHLQLKIFFPAENYQNEVLSLSLFGVIEQSPED